MDVKLPNLGEGADSGTVVNLFVKEGDRIEKDQPVVELENEKAVATIPSTAAGVVGGAGGLLPLGGAAHKGGEIGRDGRERGEGAGDEAAEFALGIVGAEDRV